jgi:hypothetical protein
MNALYNLQSRTIFSDASEQGGDVKGFCISSEKKVLIPLCLDKHIPAVVSKLEEMGSKAFS